MDALGYIKCMMADGHGSPSSKRWIAMISMILIIIGFISNLFWDYTIDQYIFEAVAYIIIASLGITGAEKFLNKTPKDEQ